MLTQGEDVEAHALRQRGWSISAIARHLHRDRKTVRAYLNGDRQPGVRASSTPDPLERFEPYIKARFADDCHLWATALFDETAVLSAFTTARPCDRKANRPLGVAALAEATRLLGPEGSDVVVDLASYAQLIEGTG